MRRCDEDSEIISLISDSELSPIHQSATSHNRVTVSTATTTTTTSIVATVTQSSPLRVPSPPRAINFTDFRAMSLTPPHSASLLPVKDISTSDCVIRSSESSLIEAFPQYSIRQLQIIVKLVGDTYNAAELLADGHLTQKILVDLWKKRIADLYPTSSNEFIHVTAGEELRSALGYYKKMQYANSSNMDRLMSHHIEVVYNDSIAIDDGGLKAQFFTRLCNSFLSDESLGMFTATAGGHFLPSGEQSAVLGGLYAIVGRMIVHSILYDCTGFPYLSEAVYAYMTSDSMSLSEAVPYLKIDDLPLNSHYHVKKVRVVIKMLNVNSIE